MNLIVLNKDKFLSGFNLMDITPLSLGVEVKNNSTDKKILEEGLLMSVIIKRASKIPSNNSKIYSTTGDYQKEAKISIYEGEKKYVKYNHKLGELIVKDLTPKPKGQVKVKVKFFIDVNGILNVTASELSEKGEEIRPVKTEIEYQAIGLDDKKIEELKEKNKEYFKTIRNSDDFSTTRQRLKEIEEELEEADTEKIKYNILMNYNNTYEIFIDSLDTKFENETMFERYYLHLRELFISYTKIFNCKIGGDSKNKDKQTLIEKIKKYIEMFTDKISGYLIDLLDVLQSIPEESFYEIIVFTIEKINIRGKNCLGERKEFCKYKSLMYFERAHLIFCKYIQKITNLSICSETIKNNCKEQIIICKLYLNEIKSGSILLLEDSIKEGKLIKSNNTGFTYSAIGLQFIKGEEKEKNEVILQNYEKMLREIQKEHNIKYPNNNQTIPYDPDITEAICIANIIKISYSFLSNKNYKRLYKLGERCEYLAKLKKQTESEWYKEFSRLYEDIKFTYKNSIISKDKLREIILNKYKDKLTEIEKKFNEKKSNRQFIEFILQKYPYKGYNHNKIQDVYFEEKEPELLMALRGKYHPDQYKYNEEDEQSQFQYFIMEIIESYLNNMFENIQ